MSTYRRLATILNRIDTSTIPDIREVVRVAREKFNPPPGWFRETKGSPYAPPRVEVTVTVPEGLAYLAEHLAPQLGLTPERFMGALL